MSQTVLEQSLLAQTQTPSCSGMTNITSKMASRLPTNEAMVELPSLSKRSLVVISEDALTRLALRVLLESEYPDWCFQEIDVTENWFEKVEREKPDMVILSLSMRGGLGLRQIRQLTSSMPDTAILVLSPLEDAVYASQVLTAGATGFLSRNAEPRQILDALEQISQGRLFVSERIAEQILQYSNSTRTRRKNATNMDPISQLTPREREVFQLLGTGLSTKQIAHRLRLNAHTIETYRERIRTRIHAQDGNELVYRAILWLLMNE